MVIGVRKETKGGRAAFSSPPFFKTKKLAIVGRTESVKFTPWHDSSWTIAAHPCARGLCKREPDWYFDMHRPECFTNEGKTWNDGYYTWLKNLQTPIFMQESGIGPWAPIPMAVRYPIERILQEFRAYFTNHCAYMIALAMTEGVETIGIFGCQYSADTEHSTQRGSLEYWLGRFEQAGGNVVLPVRHNTVLAWPSKLYGYESHDAKGQLIAEYRPKRITVTKKVGAAMVVDPLQPFDPNNPEHRASLPPPPNGDAIAWSRCGVVVN